MNRGGEEVLLDVGGQDATEAFEDVGHSDEAREILDGMVVGKLKRAVCPFPFLILNPLLIVPVPLSLPYRFLPRPLSCISDGILIARAQQAEDPKPKVTAPAYGTASSTTSGGNTGLGVGLYAVILVGGALAFGAYKYLEASKEKA